jgi:hypothetical protein
MWLMPMWLNELMSVEREWLEDHGTKFCCGVTLETVITVDFWLKLDSVEIL